MITLEDISFPTPSSSLSPESIKAYKEIGFVCLNEYLCKEETETLLQRARTLEREHHREKKKKNIDRDDEKKRADRSALLRLSMNVFSSKSLILIQTSMF